MNRPLPRLALLLGLLVPMGCGPKQPTTPPPAEPPPPEPDPVDPIPTDFGALTPQIVVNDVAAAVEFYGKAFGAQTVYSIPGPDGASMMHAEMTLGDSVLMIEPSNEQMKDPMTLGGSPVTLMVYVEDVDSTFGSAVEAGAVVEMPVTNMFWGDRYGALVDPFGHAWAIATHVEDLTPEQMAERAALAAPPPPSKKKRRKKKKAKKPAWAAIEGTPATVKIPADYHTVTMSLTVDDANKAIEYYVAAFGATERSRMPSPDGRLMHAELQIGDAVLMLADEFPEMGSTSAATLGGSPVMVHHYVTDADTTFATAVDGGGQQLLPMTDMFWGDRYGALVDPVGLPWGVASRVEDVSPDQIIERMQAMMAEGAEGQPDAAADGAPDTTEAPAAEAPAT